MAANKVEIYRVSLGEPLSAVAIPLRETDEDFTLEPQELIDKVYRNARYDDLQYGDEPWPALEAGDREWAEGVVKDAGLR